MRKCSATFVISIFFRFAGLNERDAHSNVSKEEFARDEKYGQRIGESKEKLDKRRG